MSETPAPKKKDGWKTTEFWVTIVTTLAPHLVEAVPPQWKVIANAVTGAVYTLSRAFAKR